MNWEDKNVLVTGGASFIGSHLVDQLIEKGARVSIVDDLSSGRIENLEHHELYTDVGVYSVYEDTLEPRFPVDDFSHKYVKFWKDDLLKQGVAERVTHNADIVFHLAAAHGGRGYVDLHQAMPSTNLALDGMLFKACYENDVEKVVYASSGCVYPNLVQQDVEQELYLTEEDVGPPYDSDNMYGWAKLMAEKTLRSYYDEWGMKSANPRLFTAYGPRGKISHAILAMIGRTFIEQEPFKVWGDGSAIRNWTYVDDIVSGMIISAEKIEDGSPVNLGVERRISVEEATQKSMNLSGHKVDIEYLPDKPVGVLNRVCDNSYARELGWEPEITFEEGLGKTIDWFYDYHDREELSKKWGRELLMER